MNILCLADEENKGLYEYYRKENLHDADLIISCGDLNARYLEYIVTVSNKTLLYVRGNHDGNYDIDPPLGCYDIDDRIYDFNGLRILGLGGSMRYHDGKDMYTEAEMKKRIRKINSAISLRNGVDIIVAHAPVKGYGDMEDLPHQGFECFNELLNRWKPKYFLHGHVHKNYRTKDFKREFTHPSGTKIINCYDRYDLVIKDDEHPPKGRTGSTLYDLYVSIQEKNNKRKYG